MMKAKDIKVGGRYAAKVSGNLVVVRVDDIQNPQRGTSYRTNRTCYEVTNLKTKRKLVFRSAAKFRRPTISVVGNP